MFGGRPRDVVIATGEIWEIFEDVTRNDLYSLFWRSTTDSLLVHEVAFKRLNGNNPVTSCTNLVNFRSIISEFMLLKCTIFAAIRLRFDDDIHLSRWRSGTYWRSQF